jgi:hypothetical protein
MRIPILLGAAMAAVAAALASSWSSGYACAGLIGSNGAVNLGRTTTLAAYSDGVEHYVTSFEFQGGGGEFGTLIPLPGVPAKVERGGAWTLQRLAKEVPSPELQQIAAADSFVRATRAEVLQQVRIDALDVTVLRGGGPDVAAWAQAHGFRLSPDAPEVLDFYAKRSPVFLAAIFDGEAAAARGQQAGDGTPVHLTIPTDNPWVPLRILGLGKKADDFVQADVFLLTDGEPALLPSGRPGLAVQHSQPATDRLLDDLRADDGMSWVPQSAWLTKLAITTTAGDLRYDLAVDASGAGQPSAVDAGLALPPGGDALPDGLPWLAVVVSVAALLLFAARLRTPEPARP